MNVLIHLTACSVWHQRIAIKVNASRNVQKDIMKTKDLECALDKVIIVDNHEPNEIYSF